MISSRPRPPKRRAVVAFLTGMTLGVSVAGCSIAAGTSTPTTSSPSSSPARLSWTEYPLPDALSNQGLVGATAISCPTANHCVALGVDTNGNSASWLTNDGGSEWAETIIAPPEDVHPGPVVCPTVSHCVVVGFLSGQPGAWLSNDGGSTWPRRGQFPYGGPNSGGNTPYGLSCATANHCVAVGEGPDAWISRDGGATWTDSALSSSDDLSSVSCPSISACFAVGQNGNDQGMVILTRDGGATWKNLSAAPSGPRPHTIECPTTSDCLIGTGAADGNAYGNEGSILVTRDGGTSWDTVNLPAPVSIVTGIACPDSARCYAVGSYSSGSSTNANGIVLFATNDSGAPWSSRGAPGSGTINAISCDSLRACVVVGTNINGNGVVWTSSARNRAA